MKLVESVGKAATTLAAILSLSSCASVMSGSHKNVRIESNPPGAQITIRNTQGMEIQRLNTPAIASLRRSSGFFVPASYIATLEKPGYRTVEYSITPYVNPWYFPGNLLFGGGGALIGLIIVDPATGGMYGLTPSQIHAELVPVKSSGERSSSR